MYYTSHIKSERTHVNPQIKKVLYYIETHLDDDFELEYLSKIAGYSTFHFCRIFKITIGESVLSYATRLKLERAAREMNKKTKSVIEIAFDAGYKTPTGFLKAFKLQFGTTPTNYREGSYIHYNKYKDIQMNEPEIILREEVEVVFARELGDYKESSQIAWGRLREQLISLGDEYTICSSTKNITEAFGICHDDPKVTDESNIRYEAALSYNKDKMDVLKKSGFESKNVSGGKYAKVDFIGVSKGVESWYGLYAWIEKSGFTFRNEPPFEKYLNGNTETDMEKFHVEIYVPIM